MSRFPDLFSATARAPRLLALVAALALAGCASLEIGRAHV